MKAIQIGDWLQHANGKYYQVTRIDRLGDGNVHFACGFPHLWEYNNKFEPIPLTTEILEKNGWIKTKYAYGRDCMEIHGADKLTEGVDNALSMARWSIDKNFQYHFLDLYMWKGSVMKHGVHYVHQLQQAMRLMGIDKEIEL